jgi:hypothetical protein
MVGGTFAPWLKSGEVTRNSYRTAGLMQRLLDLHGVPASALNALPLLAFACAATAVLFAAGWRRSGLMLLSVLALAMGALAGAALAAPGSSMVRVVSAGPTITLIGAIVTIIAAAGSALLWRVDGNHHPNDPPVSKFSEQR